MKFKSAESGIQYMCEPHWGQGRVTSWIKNPPSRSTHLVLNPTLDYVAGWPRGPGEEIHVSDFLQFSFFWHKSSFLPVYTRVAKNTHALDPWGPGRVKKCFRSSISTHRTFAESAFSLEANTLPMGSACFNCTTSSLATDFRSTPLRGSPVQLLSQVSKLLDPGSSPACLASGCRDIADQELIWGLPRTDLGAATSNQPQSRLWLKSPNSELKVGPLCVQWKSL